MPAFLLRHRVKMDAGKVVMFVFWELILVIGTAIAVPAAGDFGGGRRYRDRSYDSDRWVLPAALIKLCAAALGWGAGFGVVVSRPRPSPGTLFYAELCVPFFCYTTTFDFE